MKDKPFLLVVFALAMTTLILCFSDNDGIKNKMIVLGGSAISSYFAYKRGDD